MAGVPDLLTVEEAARVMRIGRTKAYALAREWRTSKGQSGLPVVDIGNVLRVPRQRLEQLLGTTLTTCEAPQVSPVSIRSRPTLARLPGGDDRSIQSLESDSVQRADSAGQASEAVTAPSPTSTRTASPRRHRHARPASQLDLFGTLSPSSAER